MVEVLGIDGCRRGWVVARVAVVEGSLELSECRTFGALGDALDPRAVAIGLDMPIGLPDSVPRASDRELRAFLGRRRSSVFPTPARAVLGAHDFADALARNRAVLGVGLSLQAWHLVPKIREVDRAIAPSDQPRVSEVHPESSFAAIAGAPLATRKTTAEGRAQRIGLLREVMQNVGDGLSVDALDACAAAWTAARIAQGTARWFGDLDARDRRGLRMVVAV